MTQRKPRSSKSGAAPRMLATWANVHEDSVHAESENESRATRWLDASGRITAWAATAPCAAPAVDEL